MKSKLRIKVDVKNLAPIQAALSNANGRSTEHTYTTFDEIQRIAQAAEKALVRMGLPKAQMSGALYTSQSGEATAKAYKYSRATTTVQLERGVADWFLVSAMPSRAWDRGGARDILALTSTQNEEAVNRFRQGYEVQADETAVADITA